MNKLNGELEIISASNVFDQKKYPYYGYRTWGVYDNKYYTLKEKVFYTRMPLHDEIKLTHAMRNNKKLEKITVYKNK